MLSTSCPKPARGTYRAEREQARQRIKAAELRAKAACRARDGNRCRWPGCGATTRIESAHIVSKSVGGANDQRNLIRLCEPMHRGPRSLHSGDRRIEFMSDQGADGPCRFWVMTEAGWMVDGCEADPR